MPIRLLCFESHGSKLQISLLDGSGIYERVALVLQEKISCEDPYPWRTWQGYIETEGPIKWLISKYAGYAILSHTWLHKAPGEITYSDWNKRFFSSEDTGYRKLVNFCRAACKEHQLTFGWMDTICINKESSVELDESIRSMYDWYKRAAVCITYLAETEMLSNMHLDPWFTRGWTLQELLAPDLIKFYNRHWERFVDDLSNNDKRDIGILDQIARATTISKDELNYIRMAPISRRMQLAATREVTREEDTAYSFMGIFDVSISTAYGEGAERAFSRLLQEILVSSHRVLDILKWAGVVPFPHPSGTSRILPSSPKHYINRSSNNSLRLNLISTKPVILTHLGLRLPVILMPAIPIWDRTVQYEPIGDYTATVDISLAEHDRDIPTTYNLLNSRHASRNRRRNHRDWFRLIFAVFNFTGGQAITRIPKTCIALFYIEIADKISAAPYFNVIATNKPIVFELTKRNSSSCDSDNDFWWIKTGQLAQHGMQRFNLCL